VKFFSGLKGSRGRVKVSLIAGPPTPVEVVKVSDRPQLEPSCMGIGVGLPAIRLDAMREAFDGQFTGVCDGRYGATLRALGEGIRLASPHACLRRPPTTSAGGLACAQTLEACRGADCLADIDCTAETAPSFVPRAKRSALERCPVTLFDDPRARNCGDACPCWRVVPEPSCAANGGAPLRFEVLRKVPVSAMSWLWCSVAPFVWGSEEMAKARICR
jgi:hypothetical protein